MVDFSLAREFDVVVCLFSSIGYAGTVEKMKHAVMNMANHACPGGLIIVEPWLYPDDFRDGTVHAAFVDTSDTKIARMNVSKVENNVSILDFHYLVATEAGVEYFVERHDLALFSHEEYLSAFQAAELEVIHDQEGLGGRGLYIGVRPRE